jgi:MFS family permease
LNRIPSGKVKRPRIITSNNSVLCFLTKHDPRLDACDKVKHLVLPKRWTVLSWICICFFFFAVNWFQITVAYPLIIEELNINTVKAMALLSVFLLTYGACQLPSGYLAVTWGTKKTLITGLFIETFCSFLIYFVPNYFIFLLLRLISGIGAGLFFPSAVAIISSWFIETGELGLAIGLSTICFFHLGQSIPLIIGPIIIVALGWRTFFLLLGISGAFAAFLAIVIIEEASIKAQSITQSKITGLRNIIKNPNIWLLGIGAMGALGAANTCIPYLPTFLINFRKWNSETAHVFASVIGILSIIFSPIIGIVVDKLRRRRPQLIIGGIVCSVTYWFYSLLDVPLIWILPVLYAIFGSFLTINIFSIPSDYFGPLLSGQGLGLLMEIAMIAQIWIPTFFGMLVDIGVSQYGIVPKATTPAWLFLALINLTIVISSLTIKEPRP